MIRLAKVIFLTLINYLAFSQCTIEHWSLEKRIDLSAIVVEAKLVDKHSVWTIDRANIVTINTLEVYKVFKGELTFNYIDFVTMGGTVGDTAHIFNPSLNVAIGATGVFLLQESDDQLIPQEYYHTTATVQSFVSYDQHTFEAVDGKVIYPSIKFGLYDTIQKYTGLESINLDKEVDPDAGKGIIIPLATPIIDSVDQYIVSAGTQTVLTIYGRNFGSTRGKVGFRNADGGGGSFVYSNLEWDYVYWSDTLIKTRVISAAGTGIIEVWPKTGSYSRSNFKIYIKFSHLNDKRTVDGELQTCGRTFSDQNGSGGYTFQLSNAMKTNPLREETFTKALESWRCATNVNWVIGPTTQTNYSANDGINAVSYYSLGQNALGWSITRVSFCSKSKKGNIYEQDVAFNTAYSWTLGKVEKGGGYNFFDVCLHELGHGMQLNHTLNGDILYYSSSPGKFLGDISDVLIEGGHYTMQSSADSNLCVSHMVPLDSGCALLKPWARIKDIHHTICPYQEIELVDRVVSDYDSLHWILGSHSSQTELTGAGPHQIYFDRFGLHKVFLEAFNSYGSDTITKFFKVEYGPPSHPSIEDTLNWTCTKSNKYVLVNDPQSFEHIWFLSSYGVIDSFVVDTAYLSWTKPGNHLLKIVGVNNCGSGDTLYKLIELEDIPKADFSSASDGLFVNFFDESLNSKFYRWSFDDLDSLNLQNPTYVFPDKGDYKIGLVASNHCFSDTINKLISIDFKLSIDDLVKQPVSVYPNPVRSGASVNIDQFSSGFYELSNCLGQILNAGNFEEGKIYIENVPAGIYNLRTINGLENFNYKIAIVY